MRGVPTVCCSDQFGAKREVSKSERLSLAGERQCAITECWTMHCMEGCGEMKVQVTRFVNGRS